MKKITFDDLRQILLYRRIVKWDDDRIELDNGGKIRIEMTDCDCCARVTIMHNMNPICEAYANADAGNGGYYFSIASFIVMLPDIDEEVACEFADSRDGWIDNISRNGREEKK